MKNRTAFLLFLLLIGCSGNSEAPDERWPADGADLLHVDARGVEIRAYDDARLVPFASVGAALEEVEACIGIPLSQPPVVVLVPERVICNDQQKHGCAVPQLNTAWVHVEPAHSWYRLLKHEFAHLIADQAGGVDAGHDSEFWKRCDLMNGGY